VDFYCPARHLVVEVDGETHLAQGAYDAVRTEWLTQYDCRVVRITNAEVRAELEGVLTAILLACEEAVSGTPDRPSPCPLSPLTRWRGGLSLKSRSERAARTRWLLTSNGQPPAPNLQPPTPT
jgi:hypothetical protein